MERSERGERLSDGAALGRTLADRLLPALIFGSIAATGGLQALRIAVDRPANPTVFAALAYGLNLAHVALTALFLGVIATLFLIRPAPRSGRARPEAIVVAVAGTFVMGAVAGQPATIEDWRLLLLADALLTVGLAIAIYAATSLGHCFGIAPEARGLVTSGAYRLVRHPLYVGECVAALGALLPVVAPLTMLVFGGYCLCQVVRARLEERVLAATFPEYLAYRRRTPALLPWPRPEWSADAHHSAVTGR
jgi:protein-S-isoprenylcysteine O-methyltransferase Ste14